MSSSRTSLHVPRPASIFVVAVVCALRPDVASAQDRIRLDAKGEVVIELEEARREATTTRSLGTGSRTIRDIANEELVRSLPEDKVDGLELPVVVLSERKAITRGMRPSAATDRLQASAKKALQAIVRDPAGKWYQLEYPDIDPELDVTQHCTKQIARLPTEIAKSAAPRGTRSETRTQTPQSVIERKAASFDADASISLLFFERGMPCVVTIVCTRDADPRCERDDFIIEFTGRDRRDIIWAPTR